MTHPRILVVDDEPDILELVRYNLVKDQYEAVCVDTGEEALEMIRKEPPALIVLDLMLPGMSGFEVCRVLKQEPRTATIPIVMLTARGEEADVVAGLELGADDYLTKPFSPRILLARIRAVLRRPPLEALTTESVLSHRAFVLHPGRHEVLVEGHAVPLTVSEFRILHLLARRPGWVFTRNQLIAETQGSDASVTERSVDVHIVYLRRKLGVCGDLIETMRGVGYRLQE